jgi:hypothetical protein
MQKNTAERIYTWIDDGSIGQFPKFFELQSTILQLSELHSTILTNVARI